MMKTNAEESDRLPVAGKDMVLVCYVCVEAVVIEMTGRGKSASDHGGAFCTADRRIDR
ncbi:MAG: hypothetical protein HOP29_14980 [Phycisphaerales bacterium]|nr:hypothetical protein [Phycisphaerales bacterium]